MKYAIKNTRVPGMGKVGDLEYFDMLGGDIAGIHGIDCRHTFYYLVDENASRGLFWIIGVNYFDASNREITFLDNHRRPQKKPVLLDSQVLAIPKRLEKEDEEALETAKLSCK
ncbi:hypothetical protein QT972_14795 [Microcoleus sp. herbarium7]|uniref:hypothetical protein n=1 Tax=Microcoleus sp. herbarium7 TaxID=3055435 RepID=UPI002FD25054